MATADTNKVEIDTKSIEQFADEIARLLKQYNSARHLDKESQKHQKNLADLLTNTKKILGNSPTADDFAKFDDLLAQSELSYKLMKESHGEDQKFKEQYVKAFGEFDKNNTFNQQISKRTATTLEAVSKSVDVMSQQFKQDMKDTSFSYLTGPFGAMIDEAVSASGIKEAWADHKQRKQEQADAFSNAFVAANEGLDKSVPKEAEKALKDKIKKKLIAGQAHDGMTNIPKEGTYMLDGGERVLSPEQNKDLTGLLSSDQLNVYNVGHARDYFDPIITHDEKMFRESSDTSKKQNTEVIHSIEALSDRLTRSNLNWLTKLVLRVDSWWKRWERHPVLTTIGVLTGAMAQAVKLMAQVTLVTFTANKIWGIISGSIKGWWQGLWGKQKTDTDRIVQSNEDIADILQQGDKRDRRGSMFKWENSPVLKALFGDTAFKGPKSKFAGYSIMKQVELLQDIRDILYGESQKNKSETPKAHQTGLLNSLFAKGADMIGDLVKKAADMATGAIFGAIGKMLWNGLKKYGPKILASILGGVLGGALATATTFAAIGYAIGDWIINPIIDFLDKTFGTKISETIGKVLANIIAMIEKIPIIGKYIKQWTGDVGGLLADQEARDQARIAEEVRVRDAAENAKKKEVFDRTTKNAIYEGYKSQILANPSLLANPSYMKGIMTQAPGLIRMKGGDAVAKMVDKTGALKEEVQNSSTGLDKVVNELKNVGELIKKKGNDAAAAGKPALEDMGTYLVVNFGH